MTATRTGIGLVDVVGHDGMVAMFCRVCDGRVVVPTNNADHPATLDQLVDLIGDHLARNHPDEFYGRRSTA